nr:MAG TPA: hypothetical protein [Caudoviricetes sp.]DAF78427.1 MAG TPA: hypothetical protein [Caudoviricetes sp.]DAP28033.1 MAG TPA: hypothetical protein [Caudoviricetes sp.]
MQSLPAIALMNLCHLLPLLHSTPPFIIMVQSTTQSID